MQFMFRFGIFMLFPLMGCRSVLAESKLESEMKAEDFNVECAYQAAADHVAAPDRLKLGLPETAGYREMLCIIHYKNKVWTGPFNSLDWQVPSGTPTVLDHAASTRSPMGGVASTGSLLVYPIAAPQLSVGAVLLGVVGQWVQHDQAGMVTQLESQLLIKNTADKVLSIPYSIHLYDIEIVENPVAAGLPTLVR